MEDKIKEIMLASTNKGKINKNDHNVSELLNIIKMTNLTTTSE